MSSALLKKALSGISLLFLAALPAQAGFVVGNDAIDRPNADTWSNFVLGMVSDSFSANAFVTDWQVYANNAGTLGMLLLRPTGGTSFTVVGADFETVDSSGLHSFSFNPDTGSASVQAGDIIGLFIGTAKIDYTKPVDDDTVTWSTANGAVTSLTLLDAGKTLDLPGIGDTNKRKYSANVTAVPEPAMALSALTALAVGGLLLRRRR